MRRSNGNRQEPGIDFWGAECPFFRHSFHFRDMQALFSIKNAIGWLVHRVGRRFLSVGWRIHSVGRRVLSIGWDTERVG